MVFLVLLKGFIGTAILYLPRMMFMGGWLVGFVSLFVSMFFTYYNVLKLLKCQEESGARDFSDMGFRAYGNIGEKLVGFFIILT